jgi:hypothetical protein
MANYSATGCARQDGSASDSAMKGSRWLEDRVNDRPLSPYLDMLERQPHWAWPLKAQQSKNQRLREAA